MKILEQIQNNETVSLLLRKKRAILTTLILILGVVAGVYLVKQQQILKSRATTGTVHTINPETTTIYTNQLNVQLHINKNAFENLTP